MTLGEFVPVLVLNEVSKWFGGNPVLREITFNIEKGEVVGLIGPNGAGKTTLFNVITGFYRPRTGYVKFEGKDISRLSPEVICSLGICRTFQVTKPFSNITVLKNVMIGALSRENSLRDARRRAEETLDFVGMLDKKNFLGKNLTIADRKKLEIARGLATGPRLFLLDEVMAGLNPSELKEMVQLIDRLIEAGITLFIIEHIMNVIMSVSHRVLVLDHGEMICGGTPGEVACDERVIKAYLGEEYALAQS
ncbi:MAG: ABC transporter ATP-binding protein [Deltaproteobacteria bacterium]|nr:ABC transporter ATP-binding protein [Deltaproteobacteria bacterium]